MARDIGVNYTTANSIVSVYKKQGRVAKIPHKTRNKRRKNIQHQHRENAIDSKDSNCPNFHDSHDIALKTETNFKKEEEENYTNNFCKMEDHVIHSFIFKKEEDTDVKNCVNDIATQQVSLEAQQEQKFSNVKHELNDFPALIGSFRNNPSQYELLENVGHSKNAYSTGVLYHPNYIPHQLMAASVDITRNLMPMGFIQPTRQWLLMSQGLDARRQHNSF